MASAGPFASAPGLDMVMVMRGITLAVGFARTSIDVWNRRVPDSLGTTRPDTIKCEQS